MINQLLRRLHLITKHDCKHCRNYYLPRKCECCINIGVWYPESYCYLFQKKDGERE